MVAVSAAPVMAMMAAVGAVGSSRVDSETRSVINGLRRGVGDRGVMLMGVGVGDVGVRGVRCVANSASQSSVAVQKLPATEMASQSLNRAEELLEQWAKEPAGASGRNSETEAVRRLFMWDSLPKKGEHIFP